MRKSFSVYHDCAHDLYAGDVIESQTGDGTFDVVWVIDKNHFIGMKWPWWKYYIRPATQRLYNLYISLKNIVKYGTPYDPNRYKIVIVDKDESIS